MVNPQKERLTIDLRKSCDFKQYPLPAHFKGGIIAYYMLFILLIFVGIYAIARFTIAKSAIADFAAHEVRSMSQIRETESEAVQMEQQIQKANELIEWQSNNIHGQKLLYSLLSGLSKAVLLEKFTFKRDQQNHQATLLIDFKGGHQELNREFEPIPSKLEALGLTLITLNQSEILGGMRLKCICQMNFFKTVNYEKVF